MKVIPFSNGSESCSWYSDNCEICRTKCHNKRNIEDGFVTGDITLKTAEFIGCSEVSKNNFVSLHPVCQHKDKYKKKRRIKKSNEPTLFD